MRTTSPFALLLLALPGCGGCTSGPDGADATPPGIEQVVPRGTIRAIFEPRFVTANEADLPDDARVLGVVVEGVAKAYSLNLLNRHKVVNDRSGGTAFAAVW